MKNQLDSQVDKESAFASVDSGFDSQSSQTNDLKISIQYSQLPYKTFGIKGIRLSKLSSSLVEPLGKTHNGIPPSKCGKQMAGNS